MIKISSPYPIAIDQYQSLMSAMLTNNRTHLLVLRFRVFILGCIAFSPSLFLFLSLILLMHLQIVVRGNLQIYWTKDASSSFLSRSLSRPRFFLCFFLVLFVHFFFKGVQWQWIGELSVNVGNTSVMLLFWCLPSTHTGISKGLMLSWFNIISWKDFCPMQMYHSSIRLIVCVWCVPIRSESIIEGVFYT